MDDDMGVGNVLRYKSWGDSSPVVITLRCTKDGCPKRKYVLLDKGKKLEESHCRCGELMVATAVTAGALAMVHARQASERNGR